MATTIGIVTGPVTAQREFTNDAVAQTVLLRFAAYHSMEGTNQEKLLQVVDHLVAYMQDGAAQHQMNLARVTSRETAISDNIIT